LRYRLRHIAKDLLEELTKADESHLRGVAVAVCNLAVQRSGLKSPVVNEAMQYLLRWQAVPAGIQADLEDLVDQLDAKYFDAKDAAEAAGEGDENWHRAFHKARAAAAVLFACNEDPVRAAAESAFEANAAAHDDTAALRKVISESLHRKGDGHVSTGLGDEGGN